MNTIKIALVIPCYNEEFRIQLDQFKQFSTSDHNISFLFVNDGSTDNTASILSKFCTQNNHFNLLDLVDNVGKAEAVRRGFIHLDSNLFDYIGYWDADLATPLAELQYFLTICSGLNYQLIMGSRIQKLGSNINRKWYRHILGRIFATLASILLDMPVYDTQCGAKLFKSSTVQDLFSTKFISYWIFDVELLFRLKNSTNNFNVYEIPLSHWEDIEGSKLKLIDFCKAPIEMYNIYRKYK